MKKKPAVKNELFLEDVLTLHNEDKGATLRCALQHGDMMRIKVHKPESKEYKNVLILITSEQMEALVTLWLEWRDEDVSENAGEGDS